MHDDGSSNTTAKKTRGRTMNLPSTFDPKAMGQSLESNSRALFASNLLIASPQTGSLSEGAH